MTTQKHIDFFKQFLKHPARTWAIFPSSSSLTAEMLSHIDFLHAECIVEVGVGTGEFTREILAQKNSGTLFVGIDANEKFVQETLKEFKISTIYHGDAGEIAAFLHLQGRTTCDYIVSGLPWAVLDPQEQTDLLSKLYDALVPGGKFIAFAYAHGRILSSGIKFQRLLKHTFSHMEVSEIVRENIPPARVYCCTK